MSRPRPEVATPKPVRSKRSQVDPARHRDRGRDPAVPVGGLLRRRAATPGSDSASVQARSSGSATTAATASSTPSSGGGTRTTRRPSAASPTRSRCRARSANRPPSRKPTRRPPPTRRSSASPRRPRACATPAAAASSPTKASGSRPVASCSGNPRSTPRTCDPTRCTPRIYTGLMWLDTKLLRANYVVGLEQPGGGPEPVGFADPAGAAATSPSPRSTRASRWTRPHGGAYLDGDEIVPLADGAASFVITQDGTANVGVWGRDFTMSPDIQAVRQNLELIVDNGQLNPALQRERHQRVRRHPRQQRLRVAIGRGRHRRRRARVRRRSRDVDHRPRPHAAGGGCGAGDGARHQHRLGERVHLRRADTDGARTRRSWARSCSTA